MITRLILRTCNREVLAGLKLYHVRMTDGFISLLLLFIGSFPQLTFYYLLDSYFTVIDLFDPIYSFLLAIKILRAIELTRYIDKVQEKLFYRTTKALILIKFLVNIGLILLITHTAVSAFMFIEKIHPKSKGPHSWSTNEANPFREGKLPFIFQSTIEISYYERSGLLDASTYVKYTEALSWAVSTMTGSSYGDVTPRSFSEVCLSLVIYVVGACVLAKVFGDFASLMYLLSIEKTQER